MATCRRNPAQAARISPPPNDHQERTMTVNMGPLWIAPSACWPASP